MVLEERPSTFPLDRQIRAVYDTGTYSEADDQYCIVHMPMTSRFGVRALVAAHYDTTKDACSEQRSYEETHRATEPMGLGGEVTILYGAPSCMKEPNVLIENEGARFIVEEAMKRDSRPLFVCCIGAATNLACVYLMNLEIIKKLTVIWIKGDVYPEGGFEYNLHSDVLTANVVFQSELKLWQVPKPVYITMKVSFSELLNHVYPCDDTGKHPVENTMWVAEYKAEMMKDTSTPLGSRYLTMLRAAAAASFVGELWSLGNSPVVSLMLNHIVGHFHIIDMPCGIHDGYTYDPFKPGSRKIRVYGDIDNYFIIKGFFEKMGFYLGGSGRQRVAK